MKKTRNELGRVLGLAQDFQASGLTRRAFARSRRLHPSSLSRLLRVTELPAELRAELASLEKLSRTHLEVVATAPAEQRPAILAAIREGRSTYRIRDRRESTAVTPAVHPEPSTQGEPLRVSPFAQDERLKEVARALGASDEETLAFAAELLLILWRQSRSRVEASFAAFRVPRNVATA